MTPREKKKKTKLPTLYLQSRSSGPCTFFGSMQCSLGRIVSRAFEPKLSLFFSLYLSLAHAQTALCREWVQACYKHQEWGAKRNQRGIRREVLPRPPMVPIDSSDFLFLSIFCIICVWLPRKYVEPKMISIEFLLFLKKKLRLGHFALSS